jgi:hypothetical protein
MWIHFTLFERVSVNHHGQNKMKNIIRTSCLIIVGLLLDRSAIHAQSYSTDWHKITGGGEASAGGAYQLSGTIGQPDAGGTMSGGQYSVTGGFWSLISVVQAVGAPMLTITYSSNSVKILWPYPSSTWRLEQSPNLTSASWSPVSNIASDGTNNSLTLTSPTGKLFFRLRECDTCKLAGAQVTEQ